MGSQCKITFVHAKVNSFGRDIECRITGLSVVMVEPINYCLK